jgi:hypothetical protein
MGEQRGRPRKLRVILTGGVTLEATPDRELLVTGPPNRPLTASERDCLKEYKGEILAWIDREVGAWSVTTPAALGPDPELGHCLFRCRGQDCSGWVMRGSAGRGTCDRCGLAQVFMPPKWIVGAIDAPEAYQ